MGYWGILNNTNLENWSSMPNYTKTELDFYLQYNSLMGSGRSTYSASSNNDRQITWTTWNPCRLYYACLTVDAITGSHQIKPSVIMDDGAPGPVNVLTPKSSYATCDFTWLNTHGFNGNSKIANVTQYAANGICCIEWFWPRGILLDGNDQTYIRVENPTGTTMYGYIFSYCHSEDDAL